MTTYRGILYRDDYSAVKVAIWDWLSGGRSADTPHALDIAWRTWTEFCRERPGEAFDAMELDSCQLPGELSYLANSNALIDVIADLEEMMTAAKT